MRESATLVRHPAFGVWAVRCSGGVAGFSAPEPSQGPGVVLVRAGLFRIRDRGREAVVEPATGYLQQPGAELAFAHPRGGDVCTSVRVSPELWHAVPAGPPAGATVPVTGRLHLAHLALLRAAGRGDVEFGAAEELVRLVGLARRAAPVARPTTPASARLAAAAQEAILADDPAAAGLLPLAAGLAVSPYHLSRVFRAHTGRTLSGYRNRVRVSRALERLDAGEADLARLAADLGFADQAHLTRTVRAEVGLPPGAVRRMLAAGSSRRTTRAAVPGTGQAAASVVVCCPAHSA